MTSYSRCPQCKQLHTPGRPCPHCQRLHQQRRRRWAAAAFTLAGLALAALLLLTLAGCTGSPTTSTSPQLHRQTLNQIRANLIATPTGANPSIQADPPIPANPPTTLTPFTLPPGQLWAVDPVYCDNGAFEGQPYAYCDNRRY